MSSVEAVQGVSTPAREVRPDLDLAVLQSYELVRFYNIQELRMIQPIAVREDGLHRIAPMEPAPAPVSAVPWALSTTEPVADAPARRDVDASATPDASRGTRSAEPVCDGRAPERAHLDAGEEAEGAAACVAGQAGTPDTLPYGADIARIRELVEQIVTGREVVPFAYHYRQAGDLLEVQSPLARAAVSARQVAAVYKAY